jgi:dipeptide/tripeptide permease
MTDTNVDEISPLISHIARNSNTSDERTVFQRKISVWLILLSAGFERLAFYSLAGNLVLFLTSDLIQWSSTNSVIVSFIFLGTKKDLKLNAFYNILCLTGTSYVSALLFAWISDGRLGRAKTIIIGNISNRF